VDSSDEDEGDAEDAPETSDRVRSAAPSTAGRAPTPAFLSPIGKQRPATKRQRRGDPDMHLEGISRQTSHTNGQPNGSSSTMAKRVMTNGFNHANGSTNGNMAERDGYHGNRTDEVVRLVTQALRDLGYENAANMLVQESGHDLESPSVAAFRNAVLNGEWPEAEALLLGSDDQVGFDQPPTHNGLPLKEGVLPRDLRFAIRKQKYLELLEQHDAGSALMVLRQELTPLHTDVDSLHMLSGLILCPTAEDLRLQASWPGSGPASRKQLLADLSNAIHHSVIVPPHRLAELLGQVRQHQIERCLWHNPVEPSSLFVDHMCDKAQFPIQTVQVLKQMEEIWNLEFSHDGRYLAACGQDHLVYIWDLQASIIGEVRWELKGHTKPVVYASWSPDDSMLVTCSQDATARLWDMEVCAISCPVPPSDACCFVENLSLCNFGTMLHPKILTCLDRQMHSDRTTSNSRTGGT